MVETKNITTIKQLCQAEGIDTQGLRFAVNGVEKGIGYHLLQNDGVNYQVKNEKQEPSVISIEKENNENKNSKAIYVTINDRTVELSPKYDETPYIFLDMLNFVDIDPTKPKGNIVLQINDRDADYLEEIKDGDNISIYWDGQVLT